MAIGTTPVTLESLASLLAQQAERLDALERENRDLRSRLTVSALASDGAPADSQPDASVPAVEHLSRRWVLRRGMQAAAATVAAGVLVQRDTRQVAANHFDSGIEVNYVATHLVEVYADDASFSTGMRVTNTVGKPGVLAETTSDGNAAIVGSNGGHAPGVRGSSAGNGPGVEGLATAANSIGVKGSGRYGVWGESSTAGAPGVFGKNANGAGVKGEGGFGVWGVGSTGVVGESSQAGYAGVLGKNANGAGIKGEGGYGAWGVGATGLVGESNLAGYAGVHGTHINNTTGPGVVGDGAGNGFPGVLGKNANGTGVRGEGGTGVYGTSTSLNNFSAAVAGWHAGGGYGVIGDAAALGLPGVLGRNVNGAGVKGDGRTGVLGTGTGGPGISGESTTYGGQFKGTKAQLRLIPATSAGKPTTGSHAKGEFYLDSTGTLWICKASGTPGTWHKVSTVAG